MMFIIVLMVAFAVAIACGFSWPKSEHWTEIATANDFTPNERILVLASGEKLHLVENIDGSEYVAGMSGSPRTDPDRPNEVKGLAEAVRLEIAKQQNEQANAVMSGWGCFDDEPNPEPKPDRVKCWGDYILNDAISQATA